MRNAILITLLAILACCSGGTGGDGAPISATVVLLEEDPDVFGLLADDGTTLEPRNLPKRFCVDGMRVEFDARFLDEEGRWGKPIEIVDIDETTLPEPGNRADFAGVVMWVDLEGGFWGILGDDGNQYEPLNLPREFEVDGLRVVVAARVRRDVASAHMWGYLITIENIEQEP